MKNNRIIVIGFLGALAVSLGALGAHFLKSKLDTGLITTSQLDGFDTAVKYQMYHVLAMFLVIIFQKNNAQKSLSLAYTFFLWGIVLFSGSLYLLCTRNLLGLEWLKFLGPITPLGGICFVIGWLLLAFSNVSKNNN